MFTIVLPMASRISLVRNTCLNYAKGNVVFHTEGHRYIAAFRSEVLKLIILLAVTLCHISVDFPNISALLSIVLKN